MYTAGHDASATPNGFYCAVYKKKVQETFADVKVTADADGTPLFVIDSFTYTRHPFAYVYELPRLVPVDDSKLS